MEIFNNKHQLFQAVNRLAKVGNGCPYFTHSLSMNSCFITIGIEKGLESLYSKLCAREDAFDCLILIVAEDEDDSAVANAMTLIIEATKTEFRVAWHKSGTGMHEIDHQEGAPRGVLVIRRSVPGVDRLIFTLNWFCLSDLILPNSLERIALHKTAPVYRLFCYLNFYIVIWSRIYFIFRYAIKLYRMKGYKPDKSMK
jgi:hypothetical protein